MNGYTGKILRINLTNKEISTIDTKEYEQWGGGHGMGSAIFWDLCEDKAISGFDPKNVVTIMTSPLSGTLTPSASSRTEVQGIGLQAHPIDWFTRSNFGGRFGAMLKFAGWDGIVIEGKADKPVYLEVVNDNIKIKDAVDLWGLDTWATQEKMWADANKNYREWYGLNTSRDGGRTTQKPAILTIGPAGENLSRIGCIVHDAGNAAGQGGFGGVWGSKNLKAISILGTGSVKVADPSAMLQARIELQKQMYNPDDPIKSTPVVNTIGNLPLRAPGFGNLMAPIIEDSRPQGCIGCFINCRRRFESGHGNESSCVEAIFSYVYTGNAEDQLTLSDTVQKLGLNVYPLMSMSWLLGLYKMEILGPNKQIHTDLPFDKFGSLEFYTEFMNAIAYRTDIGADLADGWLQTAIKWGREEDLETGLLATPNWGYPEHYDPRLEIEWSYSSILSSRDINDHSINFISHWIPEVAIMLGGIEEVVPAEEMVNGIAESLTPYNDPMMLDYSEEGIYSDAKVKMVAWLMRYGNFWKNSLAYCDWAWPGLINPNQEDNKAYSPKYEPIFYNAATGNDITFEDGMNIGRKIWNLDRAINILQGRHRDMEVHAGYVYNKPTNVPYGLPVKENGEWHYDECLGRVLDKEKFEDWKTRYFKFEGWDPSSGWPTRKTLESIDLKHVADELEIQGKLGSE